MRSTMKDIQSLTRSHVLELPLYNEQIRVSKSLLWSAGKYYRSEIFVFILFLSI